MDPYHPGSGRRMTHHPPTPPHAIPPLNYLPPPHNYLPPPPLNYLPPPHHAYPGTMYPPMPPMPPYLPTQDGQQFQGWQTYIPYPTQPPPAPAPTINSIQTAPPLQSLRGTSELNRGTGVQKQYLNIERGHGGK